MSPTGFQKREVLGRRYQIFIPHGYSPERPSPVVAFLNGVGENGTDGERQMAAGLPAYVREHALTFPALAVFPQCRGPWKFVGEDEQVLLEALSATQKELRVDPARIYLTGISQGGCSAFDLGAKYPELWAALVVVCGAGRPGDALRLRRMPIWIFHGELDSIVPPTGGHKFDDESVGGRDMKRFLPHARYTEYPGADHSIWDRVYADPSMWEWLFAQRRK
jgi:predicted peptidase